MDDNQLLERSAKAVGIVLEYRRSSDAYYYDDPESGREQWYPLDDAAQILHLVATLKISLDMAGPHPAAVFFHPKRLKFIHYRENQAEQGLQHAINRAVVRAAAEIWSSMQ